MRFRHTKNKDTFYLEVSDQKLSDLKKKNLKRSLFSLKHCLSVKLKIMLWVVEYYVNNVNITISR